MRIEVNGTIRKQDENQSFNAEEYDRHRLSDWISYKFRDIAYKNIKEQGNNKAKILFHVYTEQENKELLDKKSNDKIKSLELVREIFIENTNKTWEEEIKAKDTIFLGKRKKQLDLINFLDKEIEKLKILK